jgi:hypothetical protein
MGASRTGGIGERPHGYRARESTPDAIRREAKTLLIKGERITRKMVIEMMGVPPEPELPKAEKKGKHTDIRPAAVEPEMALIDIMNAAEPIARVEQAAAAEAVTPILRQRYRDELLRIAGWLTGAARRLEELGHLLVGVALSCSEKAGCLEPAHGREPAPVGMGTAAPELGPGAPFVPVRTTDGQGA